MRVVLRNFGPAVADEIKVLAVEADDGTNLGSACLGRPMTMDDGEVDLKVDISPGVAKGRASLELVITWRDGEEREIRVGARA